MKAFTPRSMKQVLRSPPVIVGELAAIACAGALGATWPQWQVFRSLWFVLLTALAAASLAVVIVDQLQRLRLLWSRQPTPAHFQTAPYCAEFERPARVARAGPQIRIWTENRLGLAGSAIFHTGLLLVIVAGLLRALFATEAVVDLIEGETLPPTAQAWAAQFPGLLAKPIRIESPLTLQAVQAARYADGDLRHLAIRLSVGGNPAEVAVNHDLAVGGSRVFLGSDFGPAALVEWNRAKREAVLLTPSGRGAYEGVSSGPDGLRVHLRAMSDRPASLEVRVMKDNGLLRAGELRPGDSLRLPGGNILTLHGTPSWARLRGSRDSALWLAWVGFALVMAGGVMVFGMVKVDACVVVTPAGGRERVFVALKPARFAPMFQERFQRLVREQGAPA